MVLRSLTTRRRSLKVGLGATALSAACVLATTPTANALLDTAAPVQPYLAEQMSSLGAGETTQVLVHSTTANKAREAIKRAGLVAGVAFEKIAVVAASGTADQIAVLGTQPHVLYLEGNTEIEFADYTSNKATRGAAAVATQTGANGTALDGSGVTVGVIDSGIDPLHPYFDGAVRANYKVACDPFEIACQVRDAGPVDTDTTAAGGHGTHVSGIVAGRPTETGNGTVSGAAPGANLVSLSTGAVLFIIGADTALNWVLENHRAPCGENVSAAQCPPIKVTNNSYGPSGGGAFDPNSATVKLQRALAAEGVVTVWANGNDGGDGSESLSNPPGQDPTGGVLSVASYNDLETGTRNGELSDFSSRGRTGQQGTYPDLSAPGDTITSACRIYLPICTTGFDPTSGGDYNTISGTSMAAPHVAGIVAQLFQAVPSATPAQIEQALKATAHKYSFGAAYEPAGNGLSTSYDKGTGLVDVVAAADYLRANN